MYNRFRYQLPFLLTFCLFTNLLPAMGAVVCPTDVTRLAVAEFANSGQNLSLRIVDLAGKSDVINTQFRVNYRAQDNFDDAFNAPTLYEGEIPADLVSRSYNNFTLALGKLKIPSQALNPGVKVDVEVVAIRSLGGRSAQQKISWQGVIRKR